MGLFSKRFEDTVFLKETSDLQDQYNALVKLNEEYPNNEDILEELVIVKKGLKGENEIAYQLKKSNIGMYVLRDVKFQYEDLTAQIDYIIITPVYRYFVECKNLVGDITVNEKGDFIRELIVNGRKVKKGMYSPLRQVEAQREVVRKCSMKNQTMFDKIRDNLFNTKDSYYDYRRVLVVAANPETILNTSKAPKDIKNKVIRADALIRTIENDIRESKEEFPLKEKDMKLIAENYLETEQSSTDYYEFYKNKFNLEQQIKIEQPNKETPQVEIEILEEDNPNDIELKNRLKELRTKISKEQIIPAYYVYNNEELDRIVERKPKTIEELREVLPAVKVNSHGKKIIEELTK